MLQSNFRTAKAGYFDSNFSPLLQTLVDERDRSKSATKEKYTRFYDLLEEITERHRIAKVLQDDQEGRDTVADEAVKLVVPSLQRFIQRNGGKDFSKSELPRMRLCLVSMADVNVQIPRNVGMDCE